jgi:two-component system response regulator FixJ
MPGALNATRPRPDEVRVFVVDDDDAVRDSLKLLLELHGLAVEDYGSTAEFAACYRPPARGCLILDQHLPVTTGLDFLATAAGRSLGVPVILITGRGDESLRARAMKAGIAAFMDKPVAEPLLIAAVERLIASA